MIIRDWYYVEARLIAPAPDVSDARERIRAAGYSAEADRLYEAEKAFIDACREVRIAVEKRVRAEHPGAV